MNIDTEKQLIESVFNKVEGDNGHLRLPSVLYTLAVESEQKFTEMDLYTHTFFSCWQLFEPTAAEGHIYLFL